MLLAPLAIMAAEEKLQAPTVTVQAVSRRAGASAAVQTSDAVIPMTLVIVNGSDRELQAPQLVIAPNDEFRISASGRLPAFIAPFSTFAGAFELRPQQNVSWGKHDIVLTVQYRWVDGTRRFTSAQPVTASIEMKRRFDEEAKGLPGGTAALLHLLLPVFPAFFAYQFVDRLRRGEGVQMPLFGAEYLLPGFFIGLLVHFLAGPQVSHPRVLIAAALAGAAWPALRWAWETYQWKRWGFRETDDDRTYLRKALLSPWVRRRNLWVTVKAGEETWSGMLLQQPDGCRVLGARLLISPQIPADHDRVKALVESAVDASSRAARKQLAREVKNKTVLLKDLEAVQRGEDDYPENIASEELAGFVQQKAQRKKLAEFCS